MHREANVTQPPYLREVGVSLANEAFTLIELPLPRKESVHLSCPLPIPLLNLPPGLWTSATWTGLSAKLPGSSGNRTA